MSSLVTVAWVTIVRSRGSGRESADLKMEGLATVVVWAFIGNETSRITLKLLTFSADASNAPSKAKLNRSCPDI